VTDPRPSADDDGIDALLGEHLMVADPRISVGQAAAILGRPVAYVYRLIATGRLAAHGKKNSTRRFCCPRSRRCATAANPFH
jgi:hypothetical protein